MYAQLESVILGEALRICFPTFSVLCPVQFRIVRGKLVLSAGEDEGRVLGHSNLTLKALCPGYAGLREARSEPMCRVFVRPGHAFLGGERLRGGFRGIQCQE